MENTMKKLKELESDMVLAKAIKNEEWIIQLDAKFEDRRAVLALIDES